MNIDGISNLEYIGNIAIFYIPRSKFGVVESICHEFFLDKYDAYTVEYSDIQGFWRRRSESPLFEDENIKYVVSFHGREKIEEFVAFLGRLCGQIEEECIYLTMGYKSYLVFPGPHE